MNNKRIVPFLVGLLVTIGLGACEVSIYNNTPYATFITDLNNDTQEWLIPLFTRKLTPINGKRAHFQIIVYKKFGLEPVAFELKQTACSDTHAIDLTVKQIIDQELGKYDSI